jgi:hypothetical protein
MAVAKTQFYRDQKGEVVEAQLRQKTPAAAELRELPDKLKRLADECVSNQIYFVTSEGFDEKNFDRANEIINANVGLDEVTPGVYNTFDGLAKRVASKPLVDNDTDTNSGKYACKFKGTIGDLIQFSEVLMDLQSANANKKTPALPERYAHAFELARSGEAIHTGYAAVLIGLANRFYDSNAFQRAIQASVSDDEGGWGKISDDEPVSYSFIDEAEDEIKKPKEKKSKSKKSQKLKKKAKLDFY